MCVCVITPVSSTVDVLMPPPPPPPPFSCRALLNSKPEGGEIQTIGRRKSIHVEEKASLLPPQVFWYVRH